MDNTIEIKPTFTKKRYPMEETKKKLELSKKKRLKDRKVTITKKGISVTPKMELFLDEFLKNGGNATQAALVVFKCSSIASAANMGSYYLQRAKGLARVHLEKKGYSYGKMLDVAAEKMLKNDKPEWWDRLMKMADYADFTQSNKKSTPAVVNVIQSHKDMVSSYIEGEEVEENEN